MHDRIHKMDTDKMSRKSGTSEETKAYPWLYWDGGWNGPAAFIFCIAVWRVLRKSSFSLTWCLSVRTSYTQEAHCTETKV